MEDLEKSWFKTNYNCKKSSVLKISLSFGPLLAEMNKLLKVKKLKFKKKKRCGDG